MRAIRRFNVRTVLPVPLADLDELARNLRWAWHPPTRALFADLDPVLWDEVGQVPAALLERVGAAQVDAAAADPALVARVRAAASDLAAYREEPRWYQRQPADALPTAVAYVSAGLGGLLPGAGPVEGADAAGEQVRAASDLGVPLVGVGLLPRGAEGRSVDHATTLLREADGTPVVVTVAVPGGCDLHTRVHVAEVGRVPVLLLDAPDDEDTAEGGRDDEHRAARARLRQRLLLGAGGVRALRAHARLTGAAAPEVVHVDEAAAFVGVERLRELVADGASFRAALEVVRATTVVTTSAAASADVFPVALVEEHLAALGHAGDLPVAEVLPLGAGRDPGRRQDRGGARAFDTAVLALRLADRVGAVSREQARESREVFAWLWSGFDAQEAPIGSVTHGVHAPTWVAPELTACATRWMSPQDAATGAGWHAEGPVSDAELWALRERLRARLVADLRTAGPTRLRGAVALSDDALTVGVDHRAPTTDVVRRLLADTDRLGALLRDDERPVQLVVATGDGRRDEPGADLLAALRTWADEHGVGHRVAVVREPGAATAAAVHHGCDVWLGTGRPAGGAGGMRSVLNGALHVAPLEGWWDEWYDGSNGWAVAPVGDEPDATASQGTALLDLLEHEVVPAFHDRDAAGVPHRWLPAVRRSLVSLGPKVQATRMVADHVVHLYVPAAAAGAALAADDLAGAVALADWRARVRAAWPRVTVDLVEAELTGDPAQVGDLLRVRARVGLGDLTPDDVLVQVLHGPVGPDDELLELHVEPLEPAAGVGDVPDEWVGDVKLTCVGRFGCAVRVVPRHEALTSVAATGLVTTAR